jgi:hypothetical protein
MRWREKALLHMRMDRALSTEDTIMAARAEESNRSTGKDDEPRPEPRPEPRSEARRRAAVYLDLWERHLCITAAHGAAPALPRRRGACPGR